MRKIRVFKSKEEAEKVVPLNSLKKVKIGELSLCMAHTPDGFFVVQDLCPHLGASLSKGRVNYLNEVICPLHSYRYNLSTGEESNRRTSHAQTYVVEINEEGLFIELP